MNQQDSKPEDSKEPKIIIDNDWKQQAQAEKEHLAQEEEKQQEKQKLIAEELPPVSFTTLVSSYVTQAMLALGLLEHPALNKRMVDLDLAKFNIDMLAVLEEKTKGNLSPEEKKMLDEALHQIRMAYVQLAGGQAAPPPTSASG